jgi:hypothetical protein
MTSTKDSQSSQARSQFNKKRPQKKVSDTGRMKRSKLHHRMSLAKSIGKLRKGETETPIVAIQQVHLLRKQKSFLSKQALVFEKKSKTVREQVKAIEEKIKVQKKLAASLMEGVENESEEIPSIKEHRSRPEKTIGQKAKGLFRLKY